MLTSQTQFANLMVAFAVLCGGFSLFNVPADAASAPDDITTLTDSNNAFALDLYARLSKNSYRNLYFSPYCISSELTMAYEGARGQTAAQMARVLHIALSRPRLNAAFAASWADLKKGAINQAYVVHKTPPQFLYELVMANGLWGQAGYPYDPEFLHLPGTDYGAEFHEADFISDNKHASQEINQWVNDKTADRFGPVTSADELGSNTELVLLSAVCLKAPWFEPFTDPTKLKHFHLDERATVSVPTMSENDDFLGMENDDVQALCLPYGSSDLYMLILLPRKINGLTSLEAKLTSSSLHNWSAQLAWRDVQLSLPTFRIEREYDLAPVLSSMGMDCSLNNRADFSGVSATNGLHISNIEHKARLDINEYGDAETDQVYGGLTRRHYLVFPPMVFNVDHPFLFLILASKAPSESGRILFMGRESNPTNH